MTRRSYKTEALAWKRMALHLSERAGAAKYGLTGGSDDISDAFRIALAADVLDKAIKDLERNFPPDDEAGWDLTSV